MKLCAWKNARFESYVFLILLSVEMIMSFTFLGYLHIPPVSVTTAYIPIVVIACLFEPWASAIAGFLFGLGSMLKASALYVMPDEKLFSPFQSGYPLKSLVLSVGTRVLFGLLIGWLYRFAKRGRFKWLWKSLLALSASRVQAFLVYGAMGLLFPERGLDYRASLRLDKDVVVLSLFCLLCVLACDLLYNSRRVIAFRNAVNAKESQDGWEPAIGVFLSVVAVFTLGMTLAAAVYFSNRAKYMLTVHGVTVSSEIQHDIFFLQTQFLLSVLAMCLILLLVILMIYRYMKHREYMGAMDALTEVMGRRLFLNYCAACQKGGKGTLGGWFIFLDVDRFKEINDTYGHAAGDRTLKAVADVLNRVFSLYGAVGRVGGDEFAAIIERELTKEELEQLLADFLAQVSNVLPERTVSCSIGAYHFVFPKDVAELLAQADRALYRAKAQGRACFVIREE